MEGEREKPRVSSLDGSEFWGGGKGLEILCLHNNKENFCQPVESSINTVAI